MPTNSLRSLTVPFCTLILFTVSIASEKLEKCKTYPCLIFEDNFDSLNFKTWEHEITGWGGGNAEFQYYTNNRSNSYVKNGILHLKPTLTRDKLGSAKTMDIWGSEPANLCTGNQNGGCYRETKDKTIINPIQSARLRSVWSMFFRYGRMEVVAKMPRGDWIIPEITLLPRYQAYGKWPASGEIKLVESAGNTELTDADGKPVGVQQIKTKIRFGPYYIDQTSESKLGTRNVFARENNFEVSTNTSLENGTTFVDSFHKFRLDWDSSGISFFLDDQQYYTISTENGYWKRGDFDRRIPHVSNPWVFGGRDAPFDHDFYVVFGVVVGGIGYFDDSHINKNNKPWAETSLTPAFDFQSKESVWYPTWPQDDSRALQIDSIRIWKLKEDEPRKDPRRLDLIQSCDNSSQYEEVIARLTEELEAVRKAEIEGVVPWILRIGPLVFSALALVIVLTRRCWMKKANQMKEVRQIPVKDGATVKMLPAAKR